MLVSLFILVMIPVAWHFLHKIEESQDCPCCTEDKTCCLHEENR